MEFLINKKLITLSENPSMCSIMFSVAGLMKNPLSTHLYKTIVGNFQIKKHKNSLEFLKILSKISFHKNLLLFFVFNYDLIEETKRM